MKYKYGNFRLSPFGYLFVEIRKTREDWSTIKTIGNSSHRKVSLSDTRGFLSKIFLPKPLDLDYEFRYPTEEVWIQAAKEVLNKELENPLIEGRVRYYDYICHDYGDSVRDTVVVKRYF